MVLIGRALTLSSTVETDPFVVCANCVFQLFLRAFPSNRACALMRVLELGLSASIA